MMKAWYSMEKLWDLFCKFCLIVMILIFLNSMVGDFFFRAKYSFPTPVKANVADINTLNDPIQNNLYNQKYIKAYGEKNKYALEPMAEYSISGLVVTKNSNFWFRDIMRNEFDDIALIDFGMVWGELAADRNSLYKYIKFKSKKTLGQARTLYYHWEYGSPWTDSYITSHTSHTHMIPANSNIMGGLLQVKKNNVVKIDGYLVDIYNGKGKTIAKTSLSRQDKNATSRGYGACEVMYVKSVQIGDKIYK